MTPRALRCLERCLPALDERTSSPLRVLGHATSTLHEVFEVVEVAGQHDATTRLRFIVSVRGDLSEALLVPMSSLRAAA